jgi:hypothetical protein|tara:strand:- start:221 stop:472 length:252 start_codon:yes stop_codon:yes gene_type:complete
MMYVVVTVASECYSRSELDQGRQTVLRFGKYYLQRPDAVLQGHRRGVNFQVFQVIQLRGAAHPGRHDSSQVLHQHHVRELAKL